MPYLHCQRIHVPCAISTIPWLKAYSVPCRLALGFLTDPEADELPFGSDRSLRQPLRYLSVDRGCRSPWLQRRRRPILPLRKTLGIQFRTGAGFLQSVLRLRRTRPEFVFVSSPACAVNILGRLRFGYTNWEVGKNCPSLLMSANDDHMCFWAVPPETHVRPIRTKFTKNYKIFRGLLAPIRQLHRALRRRAFRPSEASIRPFRRRPDSRFFRTHCR